MSDRSVPLPGHRVTLAAVARHAQVHVSTASRALSGDPSGVGSETVKRIRDLASVMGYRRDVRAAGLRTGSSRLIGVLVPRLTDLALATIYESIDSAASAAGYGTVVANTLDDTEHRKVRIEAMLSMGIDGMIIADSHIGDTAGHDLHNRGVPFVLVMRRLEGQLSVTADDYRGGRLAAEHLLELGHERVGVVAGDQLASTGRERTLGFQQAYEAAGRPISDRYVIESEFSIASGVSAGATLLALPNPPTAIFAVHDLIALGVMGAIREAGKQLGSDIALVGYNNLELASTLPVPLTSVSSGLGPMGRLCFEALVDKIKGRERDSVLLEPVLMARATTLGFGR